MAPDLPTPTGSVPFVVVRRRFRYGFVMPTPWPAIIFRHSPP